MNEYIVTEDCGRWLEYHRAEDEERAQRLVAEVHARRDLPGRPAEVYLIRPGQYSEPA